MSYLRTVSEKPLKWIGTATYVLLMPYKLSLLNTTSLSSISLLFPLAIVSIK